MTSHTAPSSALAAVARRFLPVVAGIALGLVFLAAAAAKGGDPDGFVEQIEAHGIVSGRLAALTAYLLVPLEAVLGVGLVFGLFRRPMAIATGALLVFFIGVTAYAWSQGNTEGCGCFGSLSSRTPGQVIVEDILLGGLALIASLPWRAARRVRPGRGRMVAGAIALVATAAAATVYEFAAPALPIDDYVTALRPGRSAADLNLGEEIEGDAPRLVALLDLGADGIGETVSALNELASEPATPTTVAFAAATEDERGAFFWTYGPQFEVIEAPASTMRPLYRSLPRLFLVRGGRVVRTWNDGVPSVAELSALVPPRSDDSPTEGS